MVFWFNSQEKVSEHGKKRICIVGAGVSGLPMIKSALEEGLEVVCYEKTSDLGGLWNYRPSLKGASTVMGSTVVNTSKEMTAYSDFPPPPENPNFMHNSKVLDYLRDYATHFKLLQHIQFNSPVDKICQSEDYGRTGRWDVWVKGKKETFHAVALASGHHKDCYKPDIPGLSKFRGQVIHSQEYRDVSNPISMEAKRVLVIGIGNSGLDIAVETSRVSEQTELSTRRGAWIWARVSENGSPYDFLYGNKLWDYLLKYLPFAVTNGYMAYKMNRKIDHQLYGLKPKHGFFAQHPTVNDGIPNCIITGQLKIRGDVAEIEGKRVRFVDGRETEVDVIVLCTGYLIGFPFLHPQNLVPVEKNVVNLYKLIFPPDLPHPTLGFIGCFQPYGSLQPMSEMQGRWFSRVVSGKSRLPSQSEMYQEIEERRKAIQQRYTKSQRHTVQSPGEPTKNAQEWEKMRCAAHLFQASYIEYCEDIGREIGATPNYFRLLFNDPRLFLTLFFGALTPYAFRLEGPGAWKGAREAILSQNDRSRAPFKNKDLPPVNYLEWILAQPSILFTTIIILSVTWCFILILLGPNVPLMLHFASLSSIILIVLLIFYLF